MSHAAADDLFVNHMISNARASLTRIKPALVNYGKVSIFLVMLCIAFVIITVPDLNFATSWFLQILFTVLALIPDSGTCAWADPEDWGRE